MAGESSEAMEVEKVFPHDIEHTDFIQTCRPTRTLIEVDEETKKTCLGQSNEGDLQTNMAVLGQVQLSSTSPSQKIYIRPIYIKMAKEIVDRLNKNTKVRIAVSGTPQIGKSTFLSYLLSHIPNATEIRKIYVLSERRMKNPRSNREEKTHLASYLCYPEKFDQNSEVFAAAFQLLAYDESKSRQFAVEASKVGAIALLDGFANMPLVIDAFDKVVVFSSKGFQEGGDANNDWQYLDGSAVWYMPSWSKEEMESFKQASREVFPGDMSIDDLYGLFGGCIGYIVRKNISHSKELIYYSKVNQHVERFNRNNLLEECTILTSTDFTAALCEIVPDEETWKEKEKKWLTKKVHQAVTYRMDVVQSRLAQQNARTNDGIVGGLWFEDDFAKIWLKPKEEQFMTVYKSFGNEKWYEKIGEKVNLPFTEQPRLIQHGGSYFPMRFNTLHRLSINAPAIDFYFVTQETQNTDGASSAGASATTYKLYLIQTSIAKRKAIKVKAVINYLERMESWITKLNKEARDKLDELLHQSGSNPDKMVEVNQRRLLYPWIEQDKDKELDVSLKTDRVDIYFVYVDQTLNSNFTGQLVNDKQIASGSGVSTRDKDIYTNKVLTWYAARY